MFIGITKADIKIIPAIKTSAFIFSKALFAGAAAIALTTAASAQEMVNVDFRYDRALSTEENYSAFERTARRACSHSSVLVTFAQERACRTDLMNQAIAGTRQPSFAAYHQQIVHGSTEMTSLTSR